MPSQLHMRHVERDEDVLPNVLEGDSDLEIVTLEARLRTAQLNADVGVLDELLSDKLLFTGPGGELASKADDLAAHRSGVVRFRGHEPQELRIRRVGSTVAIVALRAKLTVEVGGALHEGTYRYTRVWAREDGRTWRVAGGHVSPCE
jgi:ketosteroid isomerase-like protein